MFVGRCCISDERSAVIVSQASMQIWTNSQVPGHVQTEFRIQTATHPHIEMNSIKQQFTHFLQRFPLYEIPIDTGLPEGSTQESCPCLLLPETLFRYTTSARGASGVDDGLRISSMADTPSQTALERAQVIDAFAALAFFRLHRIPHTVHKIRYNLHQAHLSASSASPSSIDGGTSKHFNDVGVFIPTRDTGIKASHHTLSLPPRQTVYRFDDPVLWEALIKCLDASPHEATASLDVKATAACTPSTRTDEEPFFSLINGPIHIAVLQALQSQKNMFIPVCSNDSPQRQQASDDSPHTRASSPHRTMTHKTKHVQNTSHHLLSYLRVYNDLRLTQRAVAHQEYQYCLSDKFTSLDDTFWPSARSHERDHHLLQHDSDHVLSQAQKMLAELERRLEYVEQYALHAGLMCQYRSGNELWTLLGPRSRCLLISLIHISMISLDPRCSALRKALGQHKRLRQQTLRDCEQVFDM